MGGGGLLHHDADLLRQRDAPYRARVHDDRGRHHRPPSASARGGHVLPHRHGRAWVEHPPGRGGVGPRSPGVRRPERGRLPGDDPQGQRLQRLLHPDDRPTPRRARPGVPPADLRTRRHLRGGLLGPLLPPLRGLLHRGRARRRALPAARHPAGVRRGEELLLPALRVRRAAAAPLRRAARHRPARLPLQRGEEIRRAGPRRHQRQPGLPALGRTGPVGHEPGRLRLGRRPHQLLERSRIRAGGRGPPAALLARGHGTSWRRTSSSSTASSGLRSCSRRGSRSRSSCSSTATC